MMRAAVGSPECVAAAKLGAIVCGCGKVGLQDWPGQ